MDDTRPLNSGTVLAETDFLRWHFELRADWKRARGTAVA
jgi:hypothetical protein